MPSILCLGIATWDTLFRIDEIPTAPTKVPARDCVQVGGGMAASAAVAIARLGGQASFWARLGDDGVGRQILDQMAEEGVDVSAVRRVAGQRSPISTVLVDRRGERLVVPYYDPRLDRSPDWLPVERLAEFDVILADCRWPEGAAHGLEAARARNLVRVLDADIAPPEVWARLVPLSTHAVFSAPALRGYSGVDDLERALIASGARTDVKLSVTDGEHGFLWLEDGAVRRVPAPRVDAIDTLGAGDVFHGAFALALAEGRDIAAAGRFACVAAAIKCTRFGGRSGAPRRAEVERLLADYGGPGSMR